MAHLSLRTYAFKAMGSQIALLLDTESDDVEAAFREGQRFFTDAEQVLSRFRADSELSLLNQQAGTWVTVSRLLYDILKAATDLAVETGGAFDPTLLCALKHAGYARSLEQVSTDDCSFPLPDPVVGGWKRVQLDDIGQAVWLPPGVGLDLGGIAKGYVAQQVRDILSSQGPCLVDAGGDLVAGDAPCDLPGWPVTIALPSSEVHEAEDALMLWLANGALATSGIDYRRWFHNGRPQHHIIDPRTGLPAQTDLLTATVLASDAASAEAWATASLVNGLESGILGLTTHGYAGVLMGTDREAMVTPAMLPHLVWQAAGLRLKTIVYEAT